MADLAPAPPRQAAAVLGPGVSFFQVLAPAAIAGPNGEAGFDMFGPFGDMPTAQAFCRTKPGALLSVTLILDQTAAGIVAAPAAFKPMRQG